ncbi:hypothetical protein RND71_031565 [Anisodus tanguticus]|uniref:Fungal lipase-type domain-containing protein n=1 Tax=Anisodus tanguticus TaxID=243964 RepID=A0AAE1RBY0_9SOLA|nr:hypothetical protein RND71_031565 [Anisodus tanguticus]
MACNKEFCKDYLELKPEEASCRDLFCIFYSCELENKNFFNAPEGTDTIRGFRRRWIIFASVAMQRFLSWSRIPMNSVGTKIELWLNYPSCNGGLLHLFLNLIQGKEIIRPDVKSEKFTSIVGKLDWRVDLDKTINIGATHYGPSLSIMAAKLSYENEAFTRKIITENWQMDFIKLYNFWNAYQENHSTQAIMFQDKVEDSNLVVVAFRGTIPYNADHWITDVDLSWYELEGVGKLHAGFMKALGLQKNKGWPKEIDESPDQKLFAYYEIRKELKNILSKNEKAKFILTGHSLGGALAILFASILTLHEEEWLLDKLEGVYTFGQPRVGDPQFGNFMKDKFNNYDVKYYRHVYSNDMVPRLPYDDSTFFKHFGSCLYYNSLYNGWVVEEEPNKNYFSVLWFFPMLLIAVYEFIRGFILPWTKGSHYREEWFSKMFRMVGLVIPGLSAHTTIDYVNLTRLGSVLHPPKSAHQDCLKDD